MSPEQKRINRLVDWIAGATVLGLPYAVGWWAILAAPAVVYLFVAVKDVDG